MAAADMIRLNREDCTRTKHDSAFADWKILVGPNDWVDYLLGKEGAERYRTHNLPNCISCPGVYELGIAVPRRQAGREATRLDPDYIIPVYVGKSDNVRARLQRYGREGGHLENGFSNSEAGLFTEIFSRGFAIVYRWMPMNNNKDAERTEGRMLVKYDYPWNKGSNGVRRHNDVLRRLDGISRATPLPASVRKLQLSLEKPKGIRIKVCEPHLLENGSDFHIDFLPQILKFGRSQPRAVSMSFGVNGDANTICGVALRHGSVCIRPPITGNKRCAEHKGMKVNSVNSKVIAEGNESTRPCKTRGDENASICGFVLDNASPCARKPFQGNKRCLEHKGRRIQGFISQPTTDKIGQWTHGSILECRTYSRNNSQQHNVICGVQFNDGSFCTSQPAVGRKRCEEHKGMRIKEPISEQLGSEIPSVLTGSAAARLSSSRKPWDTYIPPVYYSPTCGATTLNGSSCSKKPSEGNKRCWQHKGRRIEEPIFKQVEAEIPSVFTDSAARLSSGKKPWDTYIPPVYYSPTCGATTLNGYPCSRKPSEGNKRCWQHKGRRY